MAIRRYQRRSVGRPPALPSMPASFAQQDQGLQQIGQALRGFAEEMQARQQAERRVQAERKLSEFQVQEAERLADLETRRGELTQIDEQYREGFQERRQALLSEFEDPETRQFADRQLSQTYLRNQLSAMRIERDRNREATVTSLSETVDNYTNDLRSHPNRLAEHQENMMRAVSETEGVIPPETQKELVRDFNDQMVSSTLTTRIERDPYEARKAINSGRFDQQLRPGSKDRLLSAVDQEIKRRESEAKILRRLSVNQMNDVLKDAEDEIADGYAPAGLDRVREMAKEIGGEEGQAALARVEFLDKSREQVQQFANSPAQERQTVLAELERQRANGMLEEPQRELHDYLKDTEERIRREADEDALTLGVRQGVIGQVDPIPFSEPTGEEAQSVLLGREEQTRELDARYGSQASPFLPAEKQAIIEALGSGDVTKQIGVISMFNSTPHLRTKISGMLKDQPDPIRRQYAVAFEHYAIDPGVATDIVRGINAKQSDAYVPPSREILAQASNDVFREGLFDGNPELRSLYTAAGEAHYLATGEGLDAESPSDYSANDIEDHIRQVLPGQVMEYRGQAFLTPDKSVDESTMMDWMDTQVEQLEGLGEDDPAPASLRRYNMRSGQMEMIEGRPKYFWSGEPIDFEAWRDSGSLRTRKPGQYYMTFSNGQYLADEEGNPYILDATELVPER